MMTIEQKERYENSCLGRYDESTNSYEELCECPELVKCDSCGYWFDEDEIQSHNGDRYCPDCMSIILDEEFNDEQAEMEISLKEFDKATIHLFSVIKHGQTRNH